MLAEPRLKTARTDLPTTETILGAIRMAISDHIAELFSAESFTSGASEMYRKALTAICERTTWSGDTEYRARSRTVLPKLARTLLLQEVEASHEMTETGLEALGRELLTASENVGVVASVLFAWSANPPMVGLDIYLVGLLFQDQQDLDRDSIFRDFQKAQRARGQRVSVAAFCKRASISESTFYHTWLPGKALKQLDEKLFRLMGEWNAEN